MAAAFAGVASGAGLASLAIQLVDGIVRLRDLCSKIRGAPKELQQLLSALSVLANILEEYEGSASAKAQGSSSNSHVLEDAIRTCAQLHGDLYELTQSFEKRMGSSSSWRIVAWAKVKFAFSDESINGLLEKLERAKSSVLLAIQTDQSMLDKQRFNSIEQGFQRLHISQQESVLDAQKQISQDVRQQLADHSMIQHTYQLDQTSIKQLGLQITSVVMKQLAEHTRATSEQQISSTPSQPLGSSGSRSSVITKNATRTAKRHTWTRFNLGFGTLTVTTEDHGKCITQPAVNPHTSSTYRLAFAPWFLNKAFALCTERSYGTVRCTMETRRLIPPEAEILRLCAEGDELAVRKLIADGKASPFDMTQEGVTPLIVAANYRHADTCRALVMSGARATGIRIADPPSSFDIADYIWAFTNFLLPPAAQNALPDWRSSSAASEASSREIARIIIESGSCEIEHGWHADSVVEDDSAGLVIDTTELSRIASLGFFEGSGDDFLWLSEPSRIGLSDLELGDFYARVLFQLLYAPAGSDPGLILAAFARVTDLTRAAILHDQDGRTLLHLIPSWLRLVPRDASERTSLCNVICRLTQAGADCRALDRCGRSPLRRTARWSIYEIVDSSRWWDPGEAARHVSTGLNSWLYALSIADVNLHEYMCTERELGAEEGMPCFVDSEMMKYYPEHFLDRDWYIQLKFIEAAEGGDHNNSQGISIDAKYFSVKSKYTAPGAFPEDESEDEIEEYYDDDDDDDEDEDEEDGDAGYDSAPELSTLQSEPAKATRRNSF